MPSSKDNRTLRFADLDLPPALLKALDESGYETPSPSRRP